MGRRLICSDRDCHCNGVVGNLTNCDGGYHNDDNRFDRGGIGNSSVYDDIVWNESGLMSQNDGNFCL